MKTPTILASGLILAFIGLSSVPTFTLAATSSKKDIKKLLNKRNILAVPNLSSQVTTYTVKSSTGAKIKVASPPTLASIPGKSIKDLFWRKINGVNVIDDLNSENPSQEACAEFFAGNVDGQSGGLGACHLAESVGYAYSTIVNSDVSACVIKNFPKKSVEKSGAITLNSGSYPDNNVEKLFSTPSGSASRIVKVNVKGGNPDEDAPRIIFVEVPTESQNTTAKALYQAKLWFCKEETNEVIGYDNIKIGTNLQLTSNHSSINGTSKNSITALGALTKRGTSLIWNAEKSRTATTQSTRNGDNFKSSIEVTKADQIKLKRLDNRDGNLGKSFLFTEYTGNTADTLRFTKGAYNEVDNNHEIQSAATFDGTFYEVDVNNGLLGTARNADLNDEFYNSSLEFDVDTSAYSCTVPTDVEVTLDADNTEVNVIMQDCAPIRPENMRFCHEDPLVKQAEENRKNKCPDPGEGGGGSGPQPTPTAAPKPTKKPGQQPPPPK